MIRASLRSVLGAVGIKPKEKLLPQAHWFDEYTIVDFWGLPFSEYYLLDEPYGLEAWYVVELRVMRQRLPKKEPGPKTCREYLIATIAKSEIQDPTGNGFLVFERVKDRRPTLGWNIRGAHPDRERERKLFQEGKRYKPAYKDEDFEKFRDFSFSPRQLYMHVDRVRILAKPYLFPTDETIAILKLSPPERISVPDPDSSSSSNTPTNATPTNATPTNATPTASTVNVTSPAPIPFHYPLGVVPKLPTIYVWELVYIARRLNSMKEVYHIFPDTIHWLPGMLIHICRAWSGATLELCHRDGKRSVQIAAEKDIHDWWEDQQRIMERQKPKEKEKADYSDVIRIIKTPRNTTVHALVEHYWEAGNQEDVLELFQELVDEHEDYQERVHNECWDEIEKSHNEAVKEMNRITQEKVKAYIAEMEQRQRLQKKREARDRQRKKVQLSEANKDPETSSQDGKSKSSVDGGRSKTVTFARDMGQRSSLASRATQHSRRPSGSRQLYPVVEEQSVSEGPSSSGEIREEAPLPRDVKGKSKMVRFGSLLRKKD